MSTLYERDFHAWCLEQAQYIMGKRFEDLDVVNLEEEIRSLAMREKRELKIKLSFLFAHLLKWMYQKESFIFPYQAKSWSLTIEDQREQIEEWLKDNPSLRSDLPKSLDYCYERAIYIAYQQTNLPYETFPKEMPFTLEQALDKNWLP